MSKQAMEIALEAMMIKQRVTMWENDGDAARFNAAIAALKEAMSSQGCDKSTQHDAEPVAWISVKDALPTEDVGTVVVFTKFGDILTAWPTYWHGASSEFNCWSFPHVEDSEITEDVTHWMPLPAAPQPKEK